MISDEIRFKYLKDGDKMLAILYSGAKLKYRMDIRLKKKKYSLRTYKYVAEGEFSPGGFSELVMPTIIGKKGQIKMTIEKDKKIETFIRKI